jgi:hypothetical protein
VARVFYVVYIEDGPVASSIDAIRLLSNPLEKRRAHITVRGPYTRRLTTSTIERMNQRLRGKSVRVTGASSFFGERQNTVFLSCSAPWLRDLWEKPQYPAFNPHITVYDGDSRLFAEGLLEILSRHELSLELPVSELTPLRSPARGQSSLDLLWSYDGGLVQRIIGEAVDPVSIRHFDERRRLEVIDRIVERLGSTPPVTREYRAAGA